MPKNSDDAKTAEAKTDAAPAKDNDAERLRDRREMNDPAKPGHEAVADALKAQDKG